MLYMRDIVVESPQEKETRRASATLCPDDERRKSNIDEQGRKKDEQDIYQRNVPVLPWRI